MQPSTDCVTETLHAKPATSTKRSDEETAHVVEELVTTLTRMRRNASLSLALDVGALIVERVFEGKLAAVHERGKRDTTFRLLGAHPRLPFSASTLWRHVRVYELVRRMPGLARCEHLTITHMQAVLGLPHEHQERLLHAAAVERWSAARLRDHARAVAASEHRGASTKHPVLRSFRRFERLQTELHPACFVTLVGNDVAERDRVLEAVNRTRAWCDEMESLLGEHAATRH